MPANYLFNCKKFILTILALIFLNYTLYAQKSKAFPISEPEAQGVSSASIDSFLNAVGRSKNEFHSFMFLRHGKVISQGWWNPYAPDLRHSLYSCSKSFTSTAVECGRLRNPKPFQINFSSGCGVF